MFIPTYIIEVGAPWSSPILYYISGISGISGQPYFSTYFLTYFLYRVPRPRMYTIETTTSHDQLWVHVLPVYFRNPVSYIHTELYKRVGTCTKERGYVVSISAIKIQGNYISRTGGECIFKTSFDTQYLLPRVGVPCTITVHTVLPDGIWGTHAYVNVYVPSSMLTNWTLVRGSFTSSCGGSISIGSPVDVYLTAVEFHDGDFSCLGEIKEGGGGEE